MTTPEEGLEVGVAVGTTTGSLSVQQAIGLAVSPSLSDTCLIIGMAIKVESFHSSTNLGPPTGQRTELNYFLVSPAPKIPMLQK